VKPRPQERHHLAQGLLVCGVAGENLPGDGPALGVYGHAQHPLGQVGSMVPGVAPLAPNRLRVPVTLPAGGVDKNDIRGLVEQVQVGETLPVPQAPKDQGRPPLPGRAGRQPLLPDSLHHPEFFTKFRQTAQQAVQRSRSYQPVAAARAGNHLLADLAPIPIGPDNLQVFIGSAISDTTFAPHEHDNNML